MIISDFKGLTTGMEKDELTADMLPVLETFAREYDRVLELELDDLGNTDVVLFVCLCSHSFLVFGPK